LAEVQPHQSPKDLVVLVADKNMEAAVTGILANRNRLGTRKISFNDPYVHAKRDPGVYRSAHEFLRPLQRLADFVLVIV